MAGAACWRAKAWCNTVRCFVAAEIREIEGRDNEVNTILSLATAIETDWLRELFPDDIKSELHVQFDAQQKRVLAAELLRFRDLALAAKRIDPPPADAAARILADEIIAGRLPLPNWDHSRRAMAGAVEFSLHALPGTAIARHSRTTTRKHIIEQLCHGAVSYKDIKEREVKPVVMSWLSQAQRELLDKHAPERLTLPNGRTPKVNYETGQITVHFAAHPGALRREPDAEHRDGPRAGDGAYSDAGHEADPGDAGSGELLARTLSQNQIRAGSGNIRNICGDEARGENE